MIRPIELNEAFFNVAEQLERLGMYNSALQFTDNAIIIKMHLKSYQKY